MSISNANPPSNSTTDETKIIYYIDDEETPYLIKFNKPSSTVTLGDFKNALNKPNYKFFFKSIDDDFGVVKEEITDDNAHLPCVKDRVVSWLVTAEGSAISESHSNTGAGSHTGSNVERSIGEPMALPGERSAGIGDSRPPSFHGPGKVIYHGTTGRSSAGGGTTADSDTLCDTCTDTDSLYSALRDRVPPLKNFNDMKGARGAGPRSQNHIPYRTGTDVESSTNFDSEEDSSRMSTLSGLQHSRGRLQRRRKRMPMSRTSSFSSVTDSNISLNFVTVQLNMDTVNFLGISLVGQSHKQGGDSGIYVGSIMKGGAVALDGRIEPGDMILQVNDISFEDKSNDDAVQILREQVMKPGPITLVVVKCWDPNPKAYFTVPRQEPVRPIDPRAWVLHTNAMTQGQPQDPLQHSGAVGLDPLEWTPEARSASLSSFNRAPSSSTVTWMPAGATATNFNQLQQHQMASQYHQGAASVVTTSSSLPESERYIEKIPLTANTNPYTIVHAMSQHDSGLEVRDRLWLKITLPNAFIGSDLVDWLLKNVEGIVERKNARKYASYLLDEGFIRHTVNKVSFSEQCYYIFGDKICRQKTEQMSQFNQSVLEDVDSVSEVDARELQKQQLHMRPLPPYLTTNPNPMGLGGPPLHALPALPMGGGGGMPDPSGQSSTNPNSHLPLLPTNSSQYSSLPVLYPSGNNTQRDGVHSPSGSDSISSGSSVSHVSGERNHQISQAPLLSLPSRVPTS